MAMTPSSMASKIKAYVNAQGMATGIADADAHQNAVLLAFCQGVIEEIQQHAVANVVTTDSNGDSGTGVGTVT